MWASLRWQHPLLSHVCATLWGSDMQREVGRLCAKPTGIWWGVARLREEASAPGKGKQGETGGEGENGRGGGCSGEQPWGSWGSRSACRPLCPPAGPLSCAGLGAPLSPQPRASLVLRELSITGQPTAGSRGQRSERSQEQTRTVKGQGAAVAMAAATLTTEGRSSGVCGICEGECSKPGY